jgi:hypothetical protein
VPDSDVALIKHFLHEGATRIGEAGLAASVSDWKYEGPGVWTGVDERVLANQQRAFEAAADVARGLGDLIPADYLNRKATLPGSIWRRELPTSVVVDSLTELRHHLTKRA